ncbi:hypothetical protein SESBI_06388 [Sesbania bispinosa]|nr:hypothetical protein SESBI_06388 [Sesbania bispinosa]
MGLELMFRGHETQPMALLLVEASQAMALRDSPDLLRASVGKEPLGIKRKGLWIVVTGGAGFVMVGFFYHNMDVFEMDMKVVNVLY